MSRQAFDLGPERALTGRLASWFAPSSAALTRDVVVGIGDDAAVVRNRGTRTVLCCDPVVEGVHFVAGTSPSAVAHKAVHRNLSDLAAMGADADWILASLLVPVAAGAEGRRLAPRTRDALLRGLGKAAAEAGCAVVGGDVGTTRGPLVLTVTAIGSLRDGVEPLRRDALRPGDRLHVTGPLGAAQESHHLRFKARLAEGRWLARQSGVRAAIDVSDGLAIDLATMLAASSEAHGASLGAELDAAALPLRAAARRRVDPIRAALDDGEDHELLFAVAENARLGRGGPLTAAARRPIGRVEARPGLRLRHPDGRVETLVEGGYRHGV
jgi:thiamine-monophosphate kinase